MEHPYIVAEIGVNHNGEVAIAKECILAARLAGADAVKFQYFDAYALAGPKTPKADYQDRVVDKNLSHREMLRQLELDNVQISEIIDFCKKLNIEFICTPYGVTEAIQLKKLGITKFKTASLDLTDYFLHDWLAKNAEGVIIATGASSYSDISACLELYQNTDLDLTLLHCVSNYPCSDSALNLLNIAQLKKRYSLKVGFSGHSVDSTAAQLACTFGIQMIERHFTLSKLMAGPDHQASDTPEMFKKYVQDVRRAITMLGTHKKSLREEEKSISNASRKSLVWINSLEVGDSIARSDLSAQRPGTGISPMLAQRLIGKKVRKIVKAGELVQLADFE